MLWAVVWWLLASWLSRRPPLALAAALVVLAVAFTPIYATAGHGSARFGTALARYLDEIRWSR